MSGSGAKPLPLRSSASPAVRSYEILPPGVMGPSGFGPDHWKLVIRQDGEVFDLIQADDLPTILQALADRSASEDRTEQSEAHHETD